LLRVPPTPCCIAVNGGFNAVVKFMGARCPVDISDELEASPVFILVVDTGAIKLITVLREVVAPLRIERGRQHVSSVYLTKE